jgi:diguanylate cyclase (GGDEF)-like protein
MNTVTDLTQAIRRELTEVLYRNLALGLCSIFLLVSIIFWQLHDYPKKEYLLIWYLGLSLNLACGLGIIVWYHRTKSEINLQHYHYYFYLIGSSLTAFFLGLLGSVLMPYDILHQALIIVAILSIVGGATQGLQASYLASFVYLIFALLPLLGWQAQQIIRGEPIFIGIFIATLGNFVYLIAAVSNGHQILENNIKLKLENINISHTLQLEKTKVEFLSEHDMLTALYNRRYMENTLLLLEREKKNLSIFMFDIDHFKNFNDNFGHEAGDAILRELGALIKSFFRTSDLAFRYGGEEFLIILENMSSVNALEYAEDFRAAVKNTPFKLHEQTFSVTVSGGVSTLPDHGTTIYHVINAADKALYRAKNQGRDQIQVAHSIFSNLNI